MIALGTTLQGKDSIPEDIASWVEERNAAFPDAKFEIDQRPLSEGDQSSERGLIERNKKGFYGGDDPATSGVLYVTFLYGKETWGVKITGGLTQHGEIRNVLTLEEGEDIVKPLSPELRNKIAGFNPEACQRVEVKGDPQRGTHDHVIYLEPRAADDVLREHAEDFRGVHWEARSTSALSMTGKELADVVRDPETLKAASLMIRDFKRDGHHN